MTGTGQLLFMAAMGVLLGVCGGYPWGRILRRRDRYAAEQDGYDACLDDYQDVLQAGRAPGRGEMGSGLATMPQPEVGLEYAGGGLASLAAGSLPGHDWREQVAAELAPEALAHADVPAGELEVLRPDEPAVSSGVNAVSPGGHPSPYAGTLTPGQRRRDKHKQRGEYAPAQGWSAPDADMLRASWKPEGQHFMADWQIEWHDHVAQIDEEIAGWVERQRGWLAADRWDRGARRLGAVA